MSVCRWSYERVSGLYVLCVTTSEQASHWRRQQHIVGRQTRNQAFTDPTDPSVRRSTNDRPRRFSLDTDTPPPAHRYRQTHQFTTSHRHQLPTFSEAVPVEVFMLEHSLDRYWSYSKLSEVVVKSK